MVTDAASWRKKTDGLDEEGIGIAHDAHMARTLMASMGWYPCTEDLAHPRFDVEITRKRAALHEMVDELARADVRVLFELVRVLALDPPRRALWDFMAEQDAKFEGGFKAGRRALASRARAATPLREAAAS